MSYHFKSSGYPGEDYLIVTKKGKEEGNLPDGIILLGGLMYCSIAFRNWIREAERNGYYVYPAKHCEDLNNAVKELGCSLDDAFMTMGFLSLPVIPELKITDKGLFSTKKWDFVEINAENPN